MKKRAEPPMRMPPRYAFWEAFWQRQMLAEARASVALDKDGGVHTCSPTCTEYPRCPGHPK